ncbi:MAG: hemolysin III family protein [Geothermobacteraceae bacterium]
MSEYSRNEEIANSLTHGIGAALALSGMILLIATALDRGDAWQLVSVSIYGVALLASLLASTLYHALPRPGVKQILRKLDHAAIFLLIAGTYTPFTLVTLRGGWGWSLFGLVWAGALLGIAAELLLKRGREIFRVTTCLLLGWVVLVALHPLVQRLELDGVLLLASGGLAFTVGVIFYLWERLPFGHAVWHLFVLAGCGLHFWVVFRYVLAAT